MELLNILRVPDVATTWTKSTSAPPLPYPFCCNCSRTVFAEMESRADAYACFTWVPADCELCSPSHATTIRVVSIGIGLTVGGIFTFGARIFLRRSFSFVPGASLVLGARPVATGLGLLGRYAAYYCSHRFLSLYAGGRLRRHQRHKIAISREEYQRITIAAQTSLSNTKRDVNVTVANAFDLKHGFSPSCVFLAHHFERLVRLMSVRAENLMGCPVAATGVDGTWTYAYTTPFLPQATERYEPMEEMVVPTGTLEEVVRSQGGLYPQVRFTKASAAVKARILQLSDHELNDATEDEIAEMYELPPGIVVKGGEARVVYNERCRRVGPIIMPGVVFDPKYGLNTAVGLGVRTVISQTYKGNSHAALRFARFIQAAADVICEPGRVQAALDLCPTEPELRRQVAYDEAQALGDELKTRNTKLVRKIKRVANTKAEVIAKENKPPRAVIDEADLVYSNLRLGWIFEHILFEICADLSIKHVAKGERIDTICEQFSVAPYVGPRPESTTMLEIDQTAFEQHERSENSVGLLAHAVNLLSKLFATICAASSADKDWARFRMERADEDDTMRFKVYVDPKEPPIVLDFAYFFMASGWRFTSSINFLIELGATLTAFTDNPEHLWSKHTKGRQLGRTFLECRGREAHRHVYQRQGRPIYVRLCVEGDDVAGQISRSLARDQQHITAQFRDLGLETKMKLVDNGRLEFVGIHMLVKHGKTIPGVWVPDIKRGLTKTGIYVGSPDAGVWGAAVVSRFLSLAEIYSGHFTPLASLFLNLAKHWASEHRVNNLVLTYEDAKIAGAAPGEKCPYQDRLSTVEARVLRDFDPAVEKKLLEMSLELRPDSMDPVAYDRLTQALSSANFETRGDEIRQYLP